MYIFSQKIKQMIGLKPFVSAFFVCMVQHLGARLVGGFASGLKGFSKSTAGPARGFGIKPIISALLLYIGLITAPTFAADIGPGNWPNVFPDIPTFNAKILTKKGPVQSWTVDYIWKKPSLNRYEKQRGQDFKTFIVENDADTGTVSELAQELDLASDEWITPTWEYPNFKYLDNYYDFKLQKDNLRIRKYKGTLKSDVSDFAKARYWKKIWVTVKKNKGRITVIQTNVTRKSKGQKLTYKFEHLWSYDKEEHPESGKIHVPTTCTVRVKAKLGKKKKDILSTVDRLVFFDFFNDIDAENLRSDTWQSDHKTSMERLNGQ